MTELFSRGETGLPDDLKALDAELSSIRYEERPSFGPELRAELARAWAEEAAHAPSPFRRHLIAAGLAALLVGTAAVPSARASFVRLMTFGGAPEPVEVADLELAPLAMPAEAVLAEPVAPPRPLMEPVREAPAIVDVAEPVTEVVISRPELLDRMRSQQLLQEAYPMRLQRRGVGGTVWLRVWVDETGLPGQATVLHSSGYGELDRTAVRVAPRFTFTPALRDGVPYGTWIQFPVLFQPDPELMAPDLRPAVDPLGLPTVPRAEWWQLTEPLDLTAFPAEVPALDEAVLLQAEADLVAALPDPSIIDRYGPARAILTGEAPQDGVSPTEWRSSVASALEHAIDLGTENPASLLAFGRIRLRQGLRTEARSFFERGLQMAVRDERVASPWVRAELHAERGRLVREHWLANEGVGRVAASAFDGVECADARSFGASGMGYASTERLMAWNYLCPGAVAQIFEAGFETDPGNTAGDLTLMMASFRAAVEAYPAHVRANSDMLLTLALEERWDDLLQGARRFAHTSGGHPTALLFAGLALHRLERTDEASDHFETALERLPVETAAALTDVGFLLDPSERRAFRDLPGAERMAYSRAFWAGRDRAASTAVNERWVEHMARATMAHLRFGSVFGDAGEVWVRFGGPTTIHIVDDGGGRLTEFWDYGSGPDITFVRWVSSERTDLTPEGRAYVDDLGKIFPPQ